MCIMMELEWRQCTKRVLSFITLHCATVLQCYSIGYTSIHFCNQNGSYFPDVCTPKNTKILQLDAQRKPIKKEKKS